jgi:protein-tyrosine phosphatase
LIDVHTHILPRIDDGAKTKEVSFGMLQREKEQGVRTVVATPHYYGRRHSPESFLEKRQNSFNLIKEKAEELGIELRLGTEVYFTEDGVVSNRALAKLAIEGTKYILIELPWNEKWTDGLWRKLDSFMAETGITPIIAHVERYAEIRKTPVYLSLLADIGCLIQVNTGAFLEENVAGMTKMMLKKGLVHCLGTDAHNLEDREPNYKETEALFEKLGEMESFRAIQKNMQTILNGERVKVPPYQGLKRFLKKYY